VANSGGRGRSRGFEHVAIANPVHGSGPPLVKVINFLSRLEYD
jgi:hypothetical protein